VEENAMNNTELGKNAIWIAIVNLLQNAGFLSGSTLYILVLARVSVSQT
jgi:hypothetical protein